MQWNKKKKKILQFQKLVTGKYSGPFHRHLCCKLPVPGSGYENPDWSFEERVVRLTSLVCLGVILKLYFNNSNIGVFIIPFSSSNKQ